ncbi:SDR family NAD(P)-dependent oxidoreductase [Gordonia soli]|uniref:Putative oxidoreductase n=1 Tax=Gordonia soli NBRC 108243 TaxID=1223545 RepID=M0QP99_9ACTN|nr:glucose 1-dehydrogenase [Gordonia soli]GAC70368.1 putative oxidoreductase [Gordonia soli NBRC 108243]
MVNELSGKVAIVTGGASGLGQGIAEKFVAEGARVAIADIDDEGGAALAAALGDRASFHHLDVSDPDAVGALTDSVVEQFGGLDVMVNNAGVSGTMHPSYVSDDLADFHTVLGVNLLGVMAGTKHAARQMASTGGSIINISSIGGIQAGGSVMTYRASKAAVIHFSKSVAIELAQQDIRVNVIAPGSIPTPLLASSAVKMGADAETFTAIIRSMMAANRPLAREGTAEDVAEAALFFATDRSRYVTATLLPVDGGTIAGPPRPPAGGAAPSSESAPDQPTAEDDLVDTVATTADDVDSQASITHA